MDPIDMNFIEMMCMYDDWLSENKLACSNLPLILQKECVSTDTIEWEENLVNVFADAKTADDFLVWDTMYDNLSPDQEVAFRDYCSRKVCRISTVLHRTRHAAKACWLLCELHDWGNSILEGYFKDFIQWSLDTKRTPSEDRAAFTLIGAGRPHPEPLAKGGDESPCCMLHQKRNV